MKVSVIIPVYNATELITKSVESTLAQPKTAEVILIKDISPDKRLAVREQLAARAIHFKPTSKHNNIL